MTSTTRPDTTNRDKLIKALLAIGFSNDQLSEIVRPMQGKTQEEKEQIAEQFLSRLRRYCVSDMLRGDTAAKEET